MPEPLPALIAIRLALPGLVKLAVQVALTFSFTSTEVAAPEQPPDQAANCASAAGAAVSETTAPAA